MESENKRLKSQSKNQESQLENATQLLKLIKKQKRQYQQILRTEQKEILEQIINNCIKIQNQDKESKILTLFQELPREQRESLLKRLTEYLSGTTEEF